MMASFSPIFLSLHPRYAGSAGGRGETHVRPIARAHSSRRCCSNTSFPTFSPPLLRIILGVYICSGCTSYPPALKLRCVAYRCPRLVDDVLLFRRALYSARCLAIQRLSWHCIRLKCSEVISTPHIRQNLILFTWPALPFSMACRVFCLWANHPSCRWRIESGIYSRLRCVGMRVSCC